MYELIQAGEHSWYIESPAKIGIVDAGGGEVCLIDTGNDGDAAKKALRILNERGWKLRAVFNTHAHVDHIGGNNFLQAHTDCPIYAPPLERFFAEQPGIGVSILFGATVPKELHNKFFIAKGSRVLPFSPEVFPEGLEPIPLPGHSHDMYGFRAPDGVVFLADALVSAATLDKYQVSFVFNVGVYLETLEKIKTMSASLFIPSHAEATEDIVPLTQKNIDKALEITDFITGFCREPADHEQVLKALFDRYSLRMSLQQYVLVGCTARSYMSWLRDTNRVEIICEKDRLLWRSV